MEVIWTIARKKIQQTKKVFKTLNSFRHYISATKSCTVEDLLLIIAVADPDHQSFLLFLPKISGAWARFSKLPIITGPVKVFCFPFQMRVSEGLKTVQ